MARLFGRKIESRSQTYGVNDVEFMKMLGINVDGVVNSKMNEIVYYRCLKVLSESISKLPLKIYKETNNGNEKVNHYLNFILRVQPNQYYSASTFWASVEWARNHWGNAFVWIQRDSMGRNAGKVRNLWLLESNRVQIWIDDKGVFDNTNALWYVYSSPQGKQYVLRQDEVLHFKNWYTKEGAGIIGVAVKDILASYLDRNAYSNKFITDMTKNGFISDKIVVQYTGSLDTKAEKALVNKLQSFTSDNGGKFIPLPVGLTANNLSSKLTDGQFLELNQYNALQIGMAFGISAQDLNDFSRATYNNSTTQYEMFYKSTLLPILQHYEQELAIKLFTQAEKDAGYYYYFDVDSILRASLKERMETYNIAVNSSIFTPNECRTMENRPTLEGGDVLLGNGNLIPIKDVGKQYNINPAPAVKPKEQDDKGVKNSEVRNT